MSDVIVNQDEKTLKIVEVGPVWNKDAFLRIKRDVGVPSVQLEQAEAGDEEEEDEEEENVPIIPIAKPRLIRKKTTNP